MCSHGSANTHHNQNRKKYLKQRNQSNGQCALSSDARSSLIYTKCVQEHWIPGPTAAGFLGLLLLAAIVRLFIACFATGAVCWFIAVAVSDGAGLVISLLQ